MRSRFYTAEYEIHSYIWGKKNTKENWFSLILETMFALNLMINDY